MSKPISIKIYNVGRANAIYIEYENNKVILFDCGEKKDNGNEHDDAKKAIKKLAPTAVVISHAHDDHNNMFCDLENMYNTNSLDLLVRKCDDASIYDKSAKEFLENNNKEVIIIKGKPDEDCLISRGYDDTYLYIGNGDKPNENEHEKFGLMSYDNTENDTSLIIVIKTNGKTVILPGDASYYSWPDAVKAEINNADHIILPHHGGGVYTEDIQAQNIPKSDATLYMSSSYTIVQNSKGLSKDDDKAPRFIDNTTNLEYNFDTKHKTYIDKRFSKTSVSSTKNLKPDEYMVEIDLT